MPRQAVVLATIGAALALTAAPAQAAETTIDFETPGPGTTITDQYKDAGGSGQGVVFGPLPGGAGAGLQPVLVAPPAGQTASGSQVADIARCSGCEFFTPRTTGTFAVPRSKVSVRVGYPGTPATTTCTAANENECAQLTLTAYDADGQVLASSAPGQVMRGGGFGTLLTVQVPEPKIVGFKVTAREGFDTNEPVAIDDLAFDVPATPPSPDFTLTPADANPVMRQGQTITDTIAIGRLSGSSGDIQLAVTSALPSGIRASLAPNPAGGTSSVLTLTADAGAAPTGANPIALTITGTPAAGAGSVQRSATLSLQVRAAFDISASGPAERDLASCVVTAPFLVSRDFSLPGPVAVSVTGVANGLQATLTPSQATFPNGAAGETVKLNIIAPATGRAVPPTTLTVHATAPGLGERTATVRVRGACPAQYDAQVTSVQITQGTQSRYLPARDGVNAAVVRYSEIPGAALLARGRPTVVRAYADNAWGPLEGVARVPMVLAGYSFDRNGTPHPLPGSPLLPNSGPRTLQTGPIDPTIPEMESDDGAYTFTLPPAWTAGEIGLSAQLQPALPPARPVLAPRALHAIGGALPGARKVTPCTTPACQLNDYFALARIPFYGSRSATITPLQLTVNGAALPDPEAVFKWVRLTTPVAINLKPYQATIDISDIAASGANGDALNTAVEDRVDDWTCDNGVTAIGVNTGVARGLRRSSSWCWSGLTSYDSAVVELARPLTSVGHEWNHLLGRKHASPGCGGGSNGQTAEAWPPDEQGFLQSVGLDTTLGSGKNGAPYDVVPGSPGRWFDLMSYCANPASLANPVRDALTLNSWISVRNWNAVMNDRGYLRAAPAARARQAAPRTASLQVNAAVTAAGVASIVSVTPLQAPPQPASSSPFRLVAFDAAGKQLADVAMLEASDHVDGQAPVTVLNAVVPAPGVASVAIVRDATTLATRKRSASAPTVALTGVPRLGSRTSTIRWRAGDADGDRLIVAVDYSADGGRSFRRIFRGPNRGSATVPARYLSRAQSARVRVTVNDGFSAATATSRRFRSPGAPPTVAILNPAGGLRQPNDATLLLSGQAFDDAGRLLTGKRLRWMLGRRLLGTGAQIAVAGLPAGRRRIALVARDGAGRSGRATVTVTLRAAQPLFLTLSAPKRAKPAARSLTLRVASSLAARLVVRIKGQRAQRYAVGRTPRRLRLKIPRSSRRLALGLTLTAGGVSRTESVAVARR